MAKRFHIERYFYEGILYWGVVVDGLIVSKFTKLSTAEMALRLEKSKAKKTEAGMSSLKRRVS